MIDEDVFLKRKILSDRFNRIIFARDRGGEIYLVGGYPRDLLLNRKCLDRDFVIGGDFREILQGIASDLGARAVSIGEKGLFRMIVQNNVTLDFSPMRKNIAYDLSKRDFTVNAMAWSPTTGIIDNNCGIGDVAGKSLRMITAANLREDPVRIIRAYRFAASLSFSVESETRRALEDYADLIKGAKPERITLEFFKILNLDEPEKALKLMREDRLLGMLIFHDDTALRKNIKALSKIKSIIHELPLKYRMMFRGEFSQNLSSKGLIRLMLVMRAAPGHIFAFSSKIDKYLELFEKGYAFCLKKTMPSRENLFELFSLTSQATPFFLVATNLCRHLPDYQLFLRVASKKILPVKEIREITGLPEGKRLGSVIIALRKAYFMERITSASAARRFVGKLMAAEAQRL